MTSNDSFNDGSEREHGANAGDSGSPAAGRRGKPPKPGFFSFENLRSLGLLILAIFAIRWSVASPYYVPTSSMEPTIKVGDRVLAWKLAYDFELPFTDFVIAGWDSPSPGDIIVFEYPKNPELDYVKRVVAVGGDTVEFKDELLYVNGERQPRTRARESREVLDDIKDDKSVKELYRENLSGREHWVMQNIPSTRPMDQGNWPPPGQGSYRVPEDSVFVVGDNRDKSADSRVWGSVPVDTIHGKAYFVLGSLYTPRGSSWPDLRWRRFGHWLYE